MTQVRVSEVAHLLGVSPDSVRRLIGSGALTAEPTTTGPTRVSGESVAAYAKSRSAPGADGTRVSARNRLEGIVTEVKTDGVMAQIEVTAGRFRLTSLMTRDAAEEMHLAPGVLATVVVKATTAVIERAGTADDQ